MESRWPALTICMKDLRQEVRTRESFTAAFFFALLVQVIFNFAFDFQRLGLGFQDVGAGALWITLTFSAVLSLQNSFLIERERSCLTALALCPCDPSSVFLGKFLANFLFVLIVQVFILPISAVFFGYDLSGAWLPLSSVIAVNAAGFSALGTLFAAVSVRTRRSELMLPLLLLPAATPVIIWGVKATRLCLVGRSFAAYGPLLGLSACFAAAFLAAGVLVFDHVLEE
ncbi:MAG TPA: heme exporter protein CcmB [Candidatus Polarisedimenticolia bacterium]|nr:heme exporter protein CcmB [Candidatus Polarisedimenticolia bacterium]